MGIACSHRDGLPIRLPGLGLEDIKRSWPAERFRLIQDLPSSGSWLTSHTNELSFFKLRFYFFRFLFI